jgi:hypothetical protein
MAEKLDPETERHIVALQRLHPQHVSHAELSAAAPWTPSATIVDSDLPAVLLTAGRLSLHAAPRALRCTYDFDDDEQTETDMG